MPLADAATLLAVWEEGVSQPPLQRALSLLAAAYPERSVEGWAGVNIGAREAALLDLQDELFGSRLDVVARCPSCRDRVEVTFSTDDIRDGAIVTSSENLLETEAAGYHVEYRLPTSADVREITETGGPDGRQMLLQRCITVARLAGAAVDPTSVPDEVAQAVMSDMSQADPLADVQIELRCTLCSHRWSTAFAILTYVWSELEEWAWRLMLEVHALASAYGWREREILALSPSRRRLYLDMLGA